jgi:flagellar biosynthesis/type III secretory pathway M-ring protein FliF/YscJ
MGVSVGDLMRWMLVGIVAIVALLAVVRPLARAALGSAPPNLPALVDATAPARTVAELQGDLGALTDGVPRIPSGSKRVTEKADDRPEHVAQLVRSMMTQEER